MRYGTALGGSPHLAPLDGLPAGWLCLRFKLREDLSDVSFIGKWSGLVDRATRLRPEGGLRLRNRTWMLGAGPTIRVIGSGSYQYVMIDGMQYVLDESQSITPDLEVGKHQIRLPYSRSKILRIRIREPRCAAPTDLTGWHAVEGGWPAAQRRYDAGTICDTLHGASMVGDWPSRCELEPVLPTLETSDEAMPDELAAMILAVELRASGRACVLNSQLLAQARIGAVRSSNLLLRGLIRLGRLPITPDAPNKG
jgi:hypothetical protein